METGNKKRTLNRKFYNKCMRNEIKVSHALILF